MKWFKLALMGLTAALFLAVSAALAGCDDHNHRTVRYTRVEEIHRNDPHDIDRDRNHRDIRPEEKDGRGHDGDRDHDADRDGEHGGDHT